MKKLTILIADDESELREQLVEFLEFYADTVYEAEDGIEAWELYKKYDPDIVMTDINMPRLSGLDLVKKIRTHSDKTKIIILSAYTNTAYLLRAVEMNLVTYLVKPIPMGKLREAILQCMPDIAIDDSIALPNGYRWHKSDSILYEHDREIKLTNYEMLFVRSLINRRGQPVSYETLHNEIYDMQEYSQDALSSIAKRVRKKSYKDLIISCYKMGYKI